MHLNCCPELASRHARATRIEHDRASLPQRRLPRLTGTSDALHQVNSAGPGADGAGRGARPAGDPARPGYHQARRRRGRAAEEKRSCRRASAPARIEATRNSGQSTPMRPDDMMAFVKPATEAQAPDEMSYVPTDDDGRANYAVGGGESGMDRSSMKERFSRAPEGPHAPLQHGRGLLRGPHEETQRGTGRRTTARPPATTPSSASSASGPTRTSRSTCPTPSS